VLFRSSKQMPGLVADASLGWGKLLGDDLEIYVIPGHQQNMLIEPNVVALSNELQRQLDRVRDLQFVRLADSGRSVRNGAEVHRSLP
jgi:hypothetical protein